MSNDGTRAIRIDACTPIEKFEGSLQAIYDENRLTKGIQIHHMI
jgi:hypothetical protein